MTGKLELPADWSPQSQQCVGIIRLNFSVYQNNYVSIIFSQRIKSFLVSCQNHVHSAFLGNKNFTICHVQKFYVKNYKYITA
jgi:hypothetical protein